MTVPKRVDLDLVGLQMHATAPGSSTAPWVREQIQAACDEIYHLRRLADANLKLADEVLKWFEICDRPCEPNGVWLHDREFMKQDRRLRSLVGARRKPG